MSELTEYGQGFRDGYLRALREFAWWKDGVEYVGCGIKTYEQARELAINNIESQYARINTSTER